MDTAALKSTWAQVTRSGAEVPLFFYSHLFLSHPELRDMFPVSMAQQRDRLVSALGRIVSHVDELDEVTGFIQQLGRDHRRFQVVAEHYSAVGASLLATLRHFLGERWTSPVAADWAAAYGVIATVMVQAAEEAAETTPAAWDAEITAVDRRSLDVCVLHVQPTEPLPYLSGQSLALESAGRPRSWRYYSPANAPRANGSLELHVQLVPGGQVSAHLVRSARAGERVRLGAPVGEALTVPDDEKRDLVMVAGGTGLAPLRAVLEQIDHRWQREQVAPAVHLFHGVRMPWNLYEHRLLTQLGARPWFRYTPVVSDDPTFLGARGLVGTVAATADDWAGRLALVCGSSAMTSHTVSSLERAGLARADIRHERLDVQVDGTELPAQPTRSGDPR